MDLHVLFLVLLAAFAHAAWNAWLKSTPDRLSSMAALAIGWLIVGVLSLPIIGLPSLNAWPYLLATTAVHTAYALVLIKAYRFAEFSLAYPIARGTGPLLVAIATPWVVGEYLEGPGLLAVILIVSGIFFIGAFGSVRKLTDRNAILLSLATGALIATYTMIDGQGARSSASPHAYAGWLFILTALPILALAKLTLNKGAGAIVAEHWRKGVPAGVLSALAYWIVVWAMTVAPLALVSATRETSILFAALMSWGLLGEKLHVLRWTGVALTVIGLVFAKF